jgi:hypothetical protein
VLKYIINQFLAEQKYPKIPITKFSIIYANDKQDVNFWSKLQFERFTSIEHLTSYVLKSNKLPISQLVGEGSWDLGKLPQIQTFISANQNLLIYTQQVGVAKEEVVNDDSKFFQYIYSQKFWAKLIYNYIDVLHRYACLFDLKSFDINTAHKPLLIAIYCLGYRYFDDKSDKLTEYFNELASQNIRRIRFKPSLANIQALRIHQVIMNIEDKISDARAILLHMTKMSYLLGLHINTKRFSHQVVYNRNLAYTKILKLLLIMTKTYKVDLSFEFDIPDFNIVNYNPEWHLLSPQMAEYLGYTEDERQIIAHIAAFENKYQDKLGLYLIFPNMDKFTNERIERICMDKVEKLTADYNEIMQSYITLTERYPNHVDFIDFDKGTLESSYLEIAILIFEHGRYKCKAENPVLIAKTFEFCDEFMRVTLLTKLDNVFEFYPYLIAFTYLSMSKHLNKAQMIKFNANLKELGKIFANKLSSNNLLNYLLFNTATYLMDKEQSVSRLFD